MKVDYLRNYFDNLVEKYNEPSFILNDPISIPHQFKRKQDIEIAGLFAATLAWGQRVTILSNCKKLMLWMDNAPYEFVLNHRERDLKPFLNFKHRTFNATDVLYFIYFLKKYYQSNHTLEKAFTYNLKAQEQTIENALIGFTNLFFDDEDAPQRTKKHVPSPLKKSACKRLCMYLRWMVRQDNMGVDFGLWKQIKSSQLVCPIDVHVERIARECKLITRKQVDWRCALELTAELRKLDPQDPAKYDFALFGLSAVR